MPIIFNKKSNVYSIAGIIINPGANKVSEKLFTQLNTHDLFKELLESDCFKTLNKEKEIKKEVEMSLPKGVNSNDKQKILDSVKVNEIEGTFDESQVQSKKISKKEQKNIDKRCKELSIDIEGKSFEEKLKEIQELEESTKPEEEE